MGEDLRLDGLAEGPPLHLGLEAHVGDLQAEAVPVHGGGLVAGVGPRAGRVSTGRRRLVEEEEEEEAGGGGGGGEGWWCHLLVGLQTAFRGLSSYFYPPTGGSTCCGTLSRATLS